MFDKRDIGPMLLQEVEKPFQDNSYLYELKYDGIRTILYVNKNSIHLITRNGVDVTYLYPELNTIKDLVGNKSIIFDGEIVAFKNNKPNFSELAKRSHLKNKIKILKMIDEVPVAFIAFDILYENRDLTNFKLVERKKILDKYPDTNYFIKAKTYQNGILLFQKVRKLDLEGIVAKKKDSIYIPKARVDYWIKIKNFKKDEFIIHGYIKNSQKYSLLLGEYRKGELYYVGKVSVIPSHPILKKILKLKKINNQFVNYKKNENYIVPKNKILVHYMERTSDNHLRQPFIKKN